MPGRSLDGRQCFQVGIFPCSRPSRSFSPICLEKLSSRESSCRLYAPDIPKVPTKKTPRNRRIHGENPKRLVNQKGRPRNDFPSVEFCGRSDTQNVRSREKQDSGDQPRYAQPLLSLP